MQWGQCEQVAVYNRQGWDQWTFSWLCRPTNICSHITTELTTHRYILIGYMNSSNFSKHE